MDQMMMTFEKIEKVETIFDILSLDDVSSDTEMIERGLTEKPLSWMIESIKQFGQVEPILVLEKTRDTGEKWYQIWSGSRRVRTLRALAALGICENTVRAQIIKEDWNVPLDILMMMLNAARDSNEIADYFAIKRIIEENPTTTISGISKALNNTLSTGEIKMRMSLGKIPTPLLNGVQTGMLTLQTARSIIKLSKKVQTELTDKVQTSLNSIKKTEDTKDIQFSEKQDIIHDIIRSGKIAMKSIKLARIENATNVATLKLAGILNTVEMKTEFHVLPINNTNVFATKKEAELFQQESTLKYGMQFTIVEIDKV